MRGRPNFIIEGTRHTKYFILGTFIGYIILKIELKQNFFEKIPNSLKNNALPFV